MNAAERRAMDARRGRAWRAGRDAAFRDAAYRLAGVGSDGESARWSRSYPGTLAARIDSGFYSPESAAEAAAVRADADALAAHWLEGYRTGARARA